jgi:hypothetical protein
MYCVDRIGKYTWTIHVKGKADNTYGNKCNLQF